MSDGFFIDRLVVVGVGLIGGSLALALKRAGAVGEVVGIGRSRANLEQALALGVIDTMAESLATAGPADGVVLATPVGQMAAALDLLASHPPRRFITDAGSTKQDVAALAAARLGAAARLFVPGHPVAGAERCGASAAHADLYDGKRVVLTPESDVDAAALATVDALWRAAGATPCRLTAARHDRVFAAVSHLPHLLAYAYVDAVAADPDAAVCLDLAGSGFRDFTRIAASPPEVWRDICLANRDALLEALDAFDVRLQALRAALAAGDSGLLEAAFSRAAQVRRDWCED